MRLLGSVGAIAVTRVLTSVCPDTRFQVGSAAGTITRWASLGRDGKLQYQSTEMVRTIFRVTQWYPQ
jgi:hypothetical protein